MSVSSSVGSTFNCAPSNYVARGIEMLIVEAENGSTLSWFGYGAIAKIAALTVLPIVLAGELACKVASLPVMCFRATKQEWDENIELIEKHSLGILFSTLAFPLILIAADAVSFLFLSRKETTERIRPFGVENVYGKEIEGGIRFPTTVKEVQEIVIQAKKEGRQISIRGAGMSQGPQTVPAKANGIVIDLKNLKTIEFGKNDETVKVGAGTRWEHLQTEANEKGKSIIVKQASNLFSVGGSIGINCHGWEHDAGAISSTVEALDVIDANGTLRHLSKTSENPEDRELFRCMFGTLGYFGVIVGATLRLADNEDLIEKSTPVSRDGFASLYKKDIQGNPNSRIIMGRLTLDSVEGNPLRDVYVNSFEKDVASVRTKAEMARDFTREAPKGKRIERIFLNAVGHLPSAVARQMLSLYWGEEKRIMSAERHLTRNEAMNIGMKSFFQLHQSDLYSQWLQEYFISEENLPLFLDYLGAQLKAHDVRLLNASIRPVPKDEVSILPYAEKARYAVVISFSQQKTKKAIANTENWINLVQKCLLTIGDRWYQPYMPYATQEEFEKCYGVETVNHMRDLKSKYDPSNLFSNGHTTKYYDKEKVIKAEVETVAEPVSSIEVEPQREDFSSFTATADSSTTLLALDRKMIKVSKNAQRLESENIKKKSNSNGRQKKHAFAGRVHHIPKAKSRRR